MNCCNKISVNNKSVVLLPHLQALVTGGISNRDICDSYIGEDAVKDEEIIVDYIYYVLDDKYRIPNSISPMVGDEICFDIFEFDVESVEENMFLKKVLKGSWKTFKVCRKVFYRDFVLYDVEVV